MKNIILLASILGMNTAQAGSPIATTAVVQCFGKFNGKIENFKARVSGDRIVFWSKNQMVEAAPKSYFESLTHLDSFGLEGSASFNAKNGYRVVSVTNAAKSISIGVSADHSIGFYNDQSSKAGVEPARTPLICKKIAGK